MFISNHTRNLLRPPLQAVQGLQTQGQLEPEYGEIILRGSGSPDLQQITSLGTPLLEAQDGLVLHLHSCTRECLEPVDTKWSLLSSPPGAVSPHLPATLKSDRVR